MKYRRNEGWQARVDTADLQEEAGAAKMGEP